MAVVVCGCGCQLGSLRELTSGFVVMRVSARADSIRLAGYAVLADGLARCWVPSLETKDLLDERLAGCAEAGVGSFDDPPVLVAPA
jgi:hypothetical protein